MDKKHPLPRWVTRGKTIRELITDLQSFSDQNREVRISLDYGETHKAISIVQSDGEEYCVLVNAEDYYNTEWQTFMDEVKSEESQSAPDTEDRDSV